MPIDSDEGDRTTGSILIRVRSGDPYAREQLVQRFLEPLQRWARGRLPARARGSQDTDDLVQETLMKALDKVSTFEPRQQGSFLAYLRRILLNRIRDLVRRVDRGPTKVPLDDRIPQDGPSPVTAAVRRQEHDAYEAALASLPASQREAIILRVELGLSHAEVAESLGLPSADAARMTVTRAQERISEFIARIKPTRLHST